MHAELETGRFSLQHVRRLSPGKAHVCTLPTSVQSSSTTPASAVTAVRLIEPC